MPVTQANGIGVYCELHGEGERLVVIGGLGSDLRLTAPLAARLAERFRVLVFDNRGAGRTDKPDEPYSIELMAADTAALMDAVGIERAHVLGISMGGRIALELALSRPERVRSLVLVSTAARTRAKVRLSWPARLLAVLVRLPPFRRMDPQPRYAFLRQREASRSYDATARLGEIRVPALVAHGRKDVTVPLEDAETLAAGIAGSELAVFGGGHAFFIRRRDELADRAVRFLETVDGA
jgi:pimeloyl-ACP methyl ester carboxylesterase